MKYSPWQDVFNSTLAGPTPRVGQEITLSFTDPITNGVITATATITKVEFTDDPQPLDDEE